MTRDRYDQIIAMSQDELPDVSSQEIFHAIEFNREHHLSRDQYLFLIHEWQRYDTPVSIASLL